MYQISIRNDTYSVYHVENDLVLFIDVLEACSRELPIVTFLVIRHGSYFSERKHAPGLMDSWVLYV